jgi:hypothetical protein
MSRFELVAIPRSHWERTDALGIADLVTDSLGCERRMTKDVNLENEYGRYSVCCQRIEHRIAACDVLQTVENATGLEHALAAGRFPLFRLDSSFIALLAATSGETGIVRFGKTFFPPEMVTSHREAFDQWISEGQQSNAAAQQRLAFFKAAEKAGCGVVELQSAFHAPEGETVPAGPAVSIVNEADKGFIDIPAFEPGDEAARLFSSAPRKRAQASILRQDIRQALQTNQPVTFGNRASHDVITEVLNEFVFISANAKLNAAALRVVYSDGSEAKPFPVFALRRLDFALSNVSPLRAALMSMRHLLLDADIDFCWFRNREVSKSRTLAEADEFCFKATISQFAANLKKGPLLLHLFHTGFEPAVIGFYRGLVAILKDSSRPPRELEVVPFYFRSRKPYERGTSWHG